MNAPGDKAFPASTDPRATAALLVEALPYIRRFWGKVVVVKYGGNAMSGADGDEGAVLASFAEDVVAGRFPDEEHSYR